MIAEYNHEQEEDDLESDLSQDYKTQLQQALE